MSIRRQPTISKFFAPVNKGGPKNFTTDEEKKEKKHVKVAEVKRFSSFTRAR